MKRRVGDKRKKVADNITESWICVDCKVNTAPGFMDGPTLRAYMNLCGTAPQRVGPDSEVYMVHNRVWDKAGMEAWNGCLCIGCLEKRLGRKLKPQDFDADNPLNEMPGTTRLRARRGY